MANIKVYEMPGCISCRLKFALGKAQPFEAFFDGGIPDKNYPAVYVARTIGQQLAIENSTFFKVGKIKLRREKRPVARVVAPKPSEPVMAPKPSEPVVEEQIDTKAYPEVKTLVDAVALLKSEYGVSATRLRGEAGVIRVAEEKNISFPNLKL